MWKISYHPFLGSIDCHGHGTVSFGSQLLSQLEGQHPRSPHGFVIILSMTIAVLKLCPIFRLEFQKAIFEKEQSDGYPHVWYLLDHSFPHLTGSGVVIMFCRRLATMWPRQPLIKRIKTWNDQQWDPAKFYPWGPFLLGKRWVLEQPKFWIKFLKQDSPTMWGPPVISWFRFAPVTIVISTIKP